MGTRNASSNSNRSHIKRPAKIRRKLRKSATYGGKNNKAITGKAWISPDGEYCNTAHAADCLGRSVSRLQSMRHEGIGPIFLKRGRSVYYRVADLKAYLENGVSVADTA
ncbi:helix-turn-helix domain-containing protein [Aliiroseovarius sp. KMU-50]|uniref:Helix-turn-helix domain-containing protein n=1 Tax=Aliiroseovarius salicola TaxID=3009082 RepID=A0ABT4W3B7_9RHOB|nr:helix-turn-helix domain-containing protein [Aliiroseovarius sp. KMU-50]MDA5095009.1 helix-turn-helix domain-containing protein [Aliiroseovarius sp. KMU-50]